MATRAIDHFGRIHEPKRTDASGAWYKDYAWRSGGQHDHYFINDLLGERRPITQQQYNDENLTTPNSKWSLHIAGAALGPAPRSLPRTYHINRGTKPNPNSCLKKNGPTHPFLKRGPNSLD